MFVSWLCFLCWTFSNLTTNQGHALGMHWACDDDDDDDDFFITHFRFKSGIHKCHGHKYMYNIYIYAHVCTHILVYICIYIYIERERGTGPPKNDRSNQNVCSHYEIWPWVTETISTSSRDRNAPLLQGVLVVDVGCQRSRLVRDV